ncbi:MAG: serine/threonine-protein kinase [Luteolibacter sp.]|nr:serine/threonine-protein kinase [Luteolibacter sp.]
MNSDELYEIIETFGGGGMGLVHRARHRLWNIEVAVKHPRPEFLLHREQVESFQSECETWAEIGLHPYVATCYYTREIENLPCVVAEYVPDGSLQDAIRNRSLYKGDEEACLARLLTIAASTAWGLARAHESNLIHCDVKPGNMLLTSYGIGKIADFGLAAAFDPSGAGAKAAGLTPVFASPEQIKGERLTPAADVWSWAASMLAMFVGEIHWESGTACGAVLTEFIEKGAKAYRIPAMPGKFASLLQKCLRYSPIERSQNLNEVAMAICEIHEQLYGEACPAGKPDLELTSTDSLNNRAVSKHDLNLTSDVHRLLAEALAIDALHPEANFNLAWLAFLGSGAISESALRNLDLVTRYDHGEYRPHLYRACLLNLQGESDLANQALNQAIQLCGVHEINDMERLWNFSRERKLNLILSPPISGEDLALDAERFGRLMAKTEAALEDRRYDDADRYLLMSGDIKGFARHPRRRVLLSKSSKSQ